MKNNKGFSLVELIIVIAIMAVLVGVLAPTYLQYVEKSKKSNDVQTVDSIVNALEICAIDPEVQVAGDWHIKITISTTQTKYEANEAKSGNDKMIAALSAIVPTTTKLKSSKWGSDLVITAANVADGYGKITIKMNPATTGNANFNAFTKHDKISFTS